jgi:non-heme chloroperoxidase
MAIWNAISPHSECQCRGNHFARRSAVSLSRALSGTTLSFPFLAVVILMSLTLRPWSAQAADEARLVPRTPNTPAAPNTPTARLSTVRVNGVTLHYQSRGNGKAIVFVHGSLVDYREWGPVAQLLENAHRTITYSRRYNYPNSNAIAGTGHSALIESEDLSALINRLKLRPVDLVGVSYGAYTAMLLTLRHPELVRSLTIVEPPLLRLAPGLPGGEKLSDEFFAMWNAARDAFIRGDSEAALRVTLDWFLGPNSMDQLSPADLATLRSNIKEWRALATSQDAFPNITLEEIHGIQIPVLMISGGRSYPILQLIDAEIEKRLRFGQRMVVADGTHDVCSEQPRTCAEAIRTFIER